MWGFHLDCNGQYPRAIKSTVIESESTSYHQHVGHDGGGDSSATATVTLEPPTTGKACTFDGSTICKAAAPETPSEYERLISSLQSSGQWNISYEVARDAVKDGTFPSTWQRPSRAYLPNISSSFFPKIQKDTPYVQYFDDAFLSTIQEETRLFNEMYTKDSDRVQRSCRHIVAGTTGFEGSWGQILLMDRFVTTRAY
jgi:hypothetical protein